MVIEGGNAKGGGDLPKSDTRFRTRLIIGAKARTGLDWNFTSLISDRAMRRSPWISPRPEILTCQPNDNITHWNRRNSSGILEIQLEYNFQNISVESQ
jgi:hypothetical protein